MSQIDLCMNKRSINGCNNKKKDKKYNLFYRRET